MKTCPICNQPADTDANGYCNSCGAKKDPCPAESKTQSASQAASITKYIALLLLVLLVFGILRCQWNRGLAPAATHTDLNTRYLALKAEEANLMAEIERARNRQDISAIPELTRKVDDLTRRMHELTTEKLEAERKGGR